MIKPQFTHEDVELLDSHDAYSGYFEIKSLQLKHRLFRGGWSQIINRELFVRGDAVGILLYDPDQDQVALVEQFRVAPFYHGEKPWLLEVVAGIVEAGETPEQVAGREALEEANCTVQAMMPIHDYYSSPGGCAERFSLFCGKVSVDELGGVFGLASESEDIKVHCLSFDKALQGLQTGLFNNGMTIIALQWLALNKAKVVKAWSHN